ncbi:hypothetical protein [Archangium primigenium]|uniref:hypothetical protein n=1 Tax=[Archangium] primigenium TaxID=2792470 RepID=UPI00195C3D61|nr:hypothetical protein [Archangium primigenium]MBM7117134.1 hypothetical protein [Archangium primigenium]
MRERGVGTQQPDIRILRGSQMLLVLDIFAQQPCMNESWVSRDIFGAPVVEVSARDILGRQDGGHGERWTSELPLLAHRTRQLKIPDCKVPHRSEPLPAGTSSREPALPVGQSLPPVPIRPLPPIASRPPVTPASLPGGLIEFRLNFFVKGQGRRAFYCLVWVPDGDGGHGELRELDSNATKPYSRKLMHRYDACLSGEMLKAAAKADVEKLKERFRRERGAQDFTLKEIPLTGVVTDFS